MQLWLLFALSAAVLWAVGQVLFKKGLDHISPLWNNIFSGIISFVILVPSVLLLSNFHIIFPSVSILLAIFGTAVTYMIFAYAISKANVSLAGTIWAIYPISTIVLSFIFLGERITQLEIIGIFIALVGVIIIGFPEKKLPKNMLKHFEWFWWAFFGALINGVGDFLAKLSNNHIGAYSQIFFMVLFLQVLGLINFFIDKNGRKLPAFSFHKFIPTILALSFFAIGNLFFFTAFNFGEASLIAPASSIYPAFMVVLAAIFLKEKITKKQLIGILAIIGGVILIGV